MYKAKISFNRYRAGDVVTESGQELRELISAGLVVEQKAPEVPADDSDTKPKPKPKRKRSK